MFAIQVASYSLICINYRAVAQAHYTWSALSDFVFASLSYFVIKRIAHSDNTFHQWLGYALGGVAGRSGVKAIANASAKAEANDNDEPPKP